MRINLALAEGRFDDALRLIAATMQLSGQTISDATLAQLTALSMEMKTSNNVVNGIPESLS
ncbi:hypothetical protein [Roseibium sp.]|uniref:hypothetical protein n=1 Tax=Roseibium sp. TaxID=1936156 RepID=UPI003B507A4E